MKIGDVVKFRDVEGRIGTLVAYGEFSEGWWEILVGGGVCAWPESQLELLEQNELTDDQLESVRGGMSQETFSVWRTEIING